MKTLRRFYCFIIEKPEDNILKLDNYHERFIEIMFPYKGRNQYNLFTFIGSMNTQIKYLLINTGAIGPIYVYHGFFKKI